VKAGNEVAITLTQTKTILGIRFMTADAAAAVEQGLRGGLVVVPAAPALVDMERNVAYRDALLGADLAITDSGLMVLLWRIFKREKIARVSGLEYLRLLLAEPGLHLPGAVAWVMPTVAARDRLLSRMGSTGAPVAANDCYLAPFYPDGELGDPALLAWIQQRHDYDGAQLNRPVLLS
jgi:hypothetical protein